MSMRDLNIGFNAVIKWHSAGQILEIEAAAASFRYRHSKIQVIPTLPNAVRALHKSPHCAKKHYQFGINLLCSHDLYHHFPDTSNGIASMIYLPLSLNCRATPSNGSVHFASACVGFTIWCWNFRVGLPGRQRQQTTRNVCSSRLSLPNHA